MKRLILAVMLIGLLFSGCKTIEAAGKSMMSAAVFADSLAHIVTTVGLYEVGKATEEMGKQIDKLPGL